MIASQMDLEALLQSNETDRIELTISSEKGDKFCEAICAFANDLPQYGRPGYLFVGAKPDGTASGLVVTDEILRYLSGLRGDGNILPPPTMNVQKCSIGGGEMAVVEVLPAEAPPVRYKGQVWIRVGPRRARATEAEERILSERRAALAKTWDARPCQDAELEDLTIDLFLTTYRSGAVARAVIDENRRSIDQQLAALRLFDLRARRPTNAGVLLMAKDPQFYFAGAFVQYVRYDGPGQESNVLRERRFSGDLLQVLRGLDELALDVADERPLRSPTGLGERIVAAYPVRALHELLMNAVIHRTYETTTPVMVNHFADRIEILNPGGLYGDLTPDQFPEGTAYRNPVVAEAAKVLGFVNRFGRGIAVAQADLARNDSPAAEFMPGPNHMLVVIRSRP